MNENKILVTGCVGFIGSHVCEYLLKNNYEVYGIDIMNDYYDINLKEYNLSILNKYSLFTFHKEDICDTNIISIFKPYKIIHLASMAGVRYSIENPKLYEKINIGGFIHIMEESVKHNVKLVVYASSSSVYGLNEKLPFSEEDEIKTCNSPYACSKMSMELYAKTYYQLHKLNTIGLRFFTVYGPRGRPDMAPYKFLHAIKNNKVFKKFGNGTSSRDYTYIDDIVQGIINALKNKNNVESEIYNLGNSKPVLLNDFIKICEEVTGNKSKYEECEMQLGDVPHTYADISKSKRDLDYIPKIDLKEGLLKMNTYMDEIQNKIRFKKICFITSLFGKSYAEVDKPSNFDDWLLPGCDYYLFTNLDEKLFNGSWKVVNIDNIFNDMNISSNIIKSRYPKFMGWKSLKDIVKKEYDVIVYCDGLMRPVGKPEVWQEYANTILNHPSGLMQKLHKRDAYKECDEIVKVKKDTPERMKKIKEFLKKKGYPKNIKMCENTAFGYDPNNIKLTETFTDFWNEYSTYNTSHRDQPLWGYFQYKHDIKPYINKEFFTRFKRESLLGFNNHRYV